MPEKRWNRVSIALIAIWLIAIARLFIADVWDETNGLVVFSKDAGGMLDLVRVILKTPLPFWRPVPTIFAAFVIHALPADVAWPLLRIINIALILASLWILRRALDRWDGPSPRRDALFILTMLFSGGAIICATWYANIFDVSALLLLACGIALLSRGRFIAAGVVFGVGFFFKETAAMALPLLPMLVAMKRITLRDSIRAGVPTVVIGAVYFALRGLVVPFGSAADTHQFHLAKLVPTLISYAGAFWIESLWSASLAIPGFLFLAFSVAVMRGWRLKLAFIASVLFAAVMYLEMFDIYQNRELMHYTIFVGRLYFIPVTLTLFVLCLDRRSWSLAILAIPLVAGAAITYTHYERFQRSYRAVYRYAAHSPQKPVRIYYPQKPLHDPRRGIEIGDFPDAILKIDPVNGKLVPR
jgi:hypothetical protein